MKKSGDKLFWISYSDLMTSLFFVMLVLFAVVTAKYIKVDPNGDVLKTIETLTDSLALANNRVDSLTVSVERYRNLTKIDSLFMPLRNSRSFEYDSLANKYVASYFKGREIFDPEKAIIKRDADRDSLLAVGREIESFLKDLNSNKGFGYIMVIEGNSANDGSWDSDREYNYKLSYDRALAVYKFWKDNSIDFRRYNTEVLIAGSGLNGLYRDPVERNNKRFSIQIIPKVRASKE